MANRDMPSQEVLRQLLEYDPETGFLFWKPRSLKWFKHERSCKSWNTRCAGKAAFTAVTDTGYRHGEIVGSRVYAHRVVWRLVTGEMPDEIDHSNGDRLDNRFSNLRNVSHAENGRNTKVPSDNTSGCIGVSLFRRDGTWRARIVVNGLDKHLGYFTDKALAIAARKAAEAEYGFHENHSRVAINRHALPPT